MTSTIFYQSMNGHRTNGITHYPLIHTVHDKDIITEWFSIIDGILTLEHAYWWDGATGFPDVKSIIRPSGGHDALAQAIRLGLLPANQLDNINADFFEWCKEDKMWFTTLAVVKAGIWAAGDSFIQPSASRPILSAP